MAKSNVYQRGQAQVNFNMTPMIDCTFQLIIFFLLATQIASADFVQMKLPRPEGPGVEEIDAQKAIVNVVPYPERRVRANKALAGKAIGYQVRTIKIEKGNIERLIRELLRAQRTSGKPEDFVVEVRADRTIHYSEIEPVLQALQQASLSKMHITARQALRGD